MSESPEEQPSTGVLGRIGSWFSPWRGKSPKSPTENASPNTDQEKVDENSEGSVRPQAKEQQGEEEEKELCSNPNPLGLSRDVFLGEENATQSSHRETTEGGPRGEELTGSRKERTGQGKEREETSNGTLVSGNPEKNANHVTHLSACSEQGVVWDCAHTQPQAQRQAQAQTGKRLHVYLEETSVIQFGKDICAEREVVRTEVTKSLKTISGGKTSPSLDLPQSSSSTSVGTVRTNPKPTDESESYYSSKEAVSLKSHKDLQLEAESDKKHTQADSMGRKNTARRKVKKNSQGEGGSSPRDKMPPTAVPEELSSDNTVPRPRGKSPKAHMDGASVNPSSKHNPTSQTSPELKKSKTSCPDTVKQCDKFQDSNPVTAATLACVIDGATNMEDDDSLYKLERKTETPESKRRSIKVSRSEVKLFTKNVHLAPKQSPAAGDQDLKPLLKNNKEESENKSQTETDARQHNLKKPDGEPKPCGRIADRINLFERTAQQVNERTFQTTRSADVSPVRKATERVKSNFMLSEQRSRSVELYDKARSSSVSPTRERPMTVTERVRNFTEASKTHNSTTKLPTKSAMTGMSQKNTSSVEAVASKEGLDGLGELDTKEQIQTNTKSEITPKPAGLATAALGEKISIPKEKPTDSNLKDTAATKAADQGMKPDSSEGNVLASGPGDSVELKDDISKQSMGPSRTGSRSKRKKVREQTSPTSPDSENKAAFHKKQVDDTDPGSASKQLREKVSPGENISDEQSFSATKRKELKKELGVIETQAKPLSSSSKKENMDKKVTRQEPKPSVNKDEPDTATGSSGTKTSIDKDAVILPSKEETAEGHSLLFTHQREKALKEKRPTPASSPSSAVNQQTQKQEPPVLDKKLSVQPEQISRGKAGKPRKNDRGQTLQQQETELINQAESRDLRESEKNDTTSQTDEQTPQQALDSNKNIQDSDRGQNILETERNVAMDADRKNALKTQAVGQRGKVERCQPEPASESSEKTPSILAKTQNVRQTVATHAQEAAACVVAQTNEEALSGTERDKEPSKGQTNVSTELPTKSIESPGKETKSGMTAVKPQPETVLVEQMVKAPDDSCTHGANGAEFPTAKPVTEATSTAEEITVKASSESPELITAKAHSMSGRDSFVKEHAQISVSESVSSGGAGQDDVKNTPTVTSVPSEVKPSGDVMKLAPGQPQCDASHDTRSTSTTTSLKGTEKTEPQPSDSPVFISAAHVVEKAAKKSFPLPNTEISLVGNGDISPHPQHHTVKKETTNDKLSQTPKAPISSKANKMIPDSIQSSSMRKLHLPRGLSKDDSATQDAPSSWLDVDFPKQKLKVPVAKLSSSGSESNLLDTSGELDDEDFVEKIKKLCTPFSLPPRKHNPLRPPQPPFAMPAIKEDRFEKTFDPAEFKFGLRNKSKYTIDTTPSTMAKLQNSEVKSGLKPARASLADRSILISSLDPHSHLKPPDKEGEEVSEEKEEQIKVKSRLEGSCVLSSLTSSFLKGKRNGSLPEVTNSREESVNESPQPSPSPLSQQPPPGLSATAPLKDSLAKQSPAPSNREEAQAVEVVVSDSGPPLPSFNDIKLPDYLEKLLPREITKSVQNMEGQEQVKNEVTVKKPTQTCGVEPEMAVKPGNLPPNAVPASFPGSLLTTQPTLPELQQPPAQPQSLLNKNNQQYPEISQAQQNSQNKQKRTPKGFHKRPGKMMLFENAQFSGQVYEIHRDVADATALQLSPFISVKVIRGCWVLYEKPDFQGRTIALEEGGIELSNMWGEPGSTGEPHPNPPMVIGSIRHVVWDYSIPHIDLFTEPEGLGRVTPYHDDTIETGSFGIPLSTASIQVHSGVWLVFSDPGFQGMLAVLEAGVYPFPEAWGFPSPFVGSLRPLKIGGLKVENASEVKAVVYEKPGFEGSCLEIESDVFSFCETEGGGGGNLDSKKLKSVGSLKIIGGLWVGYSEAGFEGQQHILEEGEYIDCRDWGGSEQLLSLQPIQSDLFSPHLKMFSNRDFNERGVNIDITVPVTNMEDTGYGMKTQSIDVISGVWVVFEEPGFHGEAYILERGLYGCPEDWGALQPRLGSAMPVVLDDFESTAKFKVQLFSEPGFQGSVLTLEDSVVSLQDGFSLASCKVLAGSWLAFEGQDFTGKMYVLEVGSYPDLRAMGCVQADPSILSLQTVGFAFSLPSITLFERRGLRGKRVILTDESVNLQLTGGCSRVQSVLVEGGIWVLYEGINYRGAQILLKPGEVPDWRELSNWLKIGSLRPLTQKQVHFRLRNKQTGLMMSVTGDLDDVKMMRIQETEENGGLEQIWFYQNGHLHCKLLEECCLSPTGSVTMAGSRIGLNPELENQVHLWSITPQGFICYTPTPELVLEVKGGHHYDKNQVILNTLDPNKKQQQWITEIV